MSDIKLFISCHRGDSRIPAGNELLYPIQVGAALADRRFPGMLHDDEGDNISAKNGSYCELTGQYWAWKHVRADYFGFLHYRRYFNFSGKEMPITHEPYIFGEVVLPSNRPSKLKKIGFDANTIESVVEGCDYIVPTPVRSPTNQTVYEQYCESAKQHKEDIDALRAIVAQDHSSYLDAFDTYLNGRDIICCNMFVARDELFQEYSEWLFSILAKFEEVRDESGRIEARDRVCGYLAERLCGVYFTHLAQKGLRGEHLQRVYFRDATWESPLPALASRVFGGR